jgi:hypothetical protein
VGGARSLRVIARSPCDEAIQTASADGFLDCFASLAMTECDARHRSSRHISLVDMPFRSRGLIHPSFAWSRHPLKSKRAQGRPGADRHPRSAARMHTRKRPHSSIQVWPNARPSLRDGRTAYAVISREPNFPLASLTARIDDAVRPVELARIFDRLDRSNDGQDHTVLPYAAHPASPRGFAGLRRRSSARSLGLTGTTRPARASRARRCRVHRNPARVSNDSRTAPLRRAGLFRCMPQFRISVKCNIFIRRG